MTLYIYIYIYIYNIYIYIWVLVWMWVWVGVWVWVWVGAWVWVWVCRRTEFAKRFRETFICNESLPSHTVARFCSANHQMMASKDAALGGNLDMGRHKDICGVLSKRHQVVKTESSEWMNPSAPVHKRA